jgi:cation diffusion facilitator family transporter
MIGVSMANKSSDKDHPYGHERFECVAALILAAVLFVTGLAIGWQGVLKIWNRSLNGIEPPALLPLIAAVVSIVVKEALYWYTRAAAKKTDSSALMAEAWHHRSDALSSVGSFAGILGARMGFPLLDPAAAVVICLFILKVAVDIFMDAVNKMTDKALDDETVEAIRGAALAVESVVGVDEINTRMFGNRAYVDVEITADQNATLAEAHDTAHLVHDSIEKAFPKVKHCSVHVNPGPGVTDGGQP